MSDAVEATFTVNGQQHTLSAHPDRPLLEILREDLQLTGTKYGCGEGACGACTVLIDGKPRFSCSTLFREIAGRKITTIEGLAKGEMLHPAQQAFLAEESFQCGYCTGGMILATAALIDAVPQPTDEQIREALDGHLCRCCVYPKIASAVRQASRLAGSHR